MTKSYTIQKIYLKIYSTLRTNFYHEVIIFQVYEMVQSIKIWIFQERNIIFPWNKEIICASKARFSEVVIFSGVNL